jgi:hypothetical protein
MAVVTLNSTRRGIAGAIPTHGDASNVIRVPCHQTVGAADSATSTYTLCEVPYNARLAGTAYWDDLASSGSPTLDFGLKSGTNVITADPDALSDGHDAATANVIGRPIVKVENRSKYAWELAGASSSPGIGTYTVFVSLVDADVNVGGDLFVDVEYTLD